MPEQDKSILNVTNEEYDGRDFVPGDNKDGVENYIGVDPIYQTYANEAEKPHAFTEEELRWAAERAGVDSDVAVDSEEGSSREDVVRSEESGDAKKKTATKRTASSPPLRDSVPEQKPSSTDANK